MDDQLGRNELPRPKLKAMEPASQSCLGRAANHPAKIKGQGGRLVSPKEPDSKPPAFETQMRQLLK